MNRNTCNMLVFFYLWTGGVVGLWLYLTLPLVTASVPTAEAQGLYPIPECPPCPVCIPMPTPAEQSEAVQQAMDAIQAVERGLGPKP